MNIIGFIFARGGSKGVPGKNIKKIAGKPLITYSIEAGLASQYINKIIVSTDDPQIAQVAIEAGAQVPFMRPGELATDQSPEWLSWQHAIRQVQDQGGQLDIFVSIPATAPLRLSHDIDLCIKTLIEDDNADMVITVAKAQHHPDFNMITMTTDGYANLAGNLGKTICRRQDAAAMYDMTTVAYVARPGFIMKSRSMFDGKIKPIVIPRSRALDIDTQFDFKIARLLIEDEQKR